MVLFNRATPQPVRPHPILLLGIFLSQVQGFKLFSCNPCWSNLPACQGLSERYLFLPECLPLLLDCWYPQTWWGYIQSYHPACFKDTEWYQTHYWPQRNSTYDWLPAWFWIINHCPLSLTVNQFFIYPLVHLSSLCLISLPTRILWGDYVRQISIVWHWQLCPYPMRELFCHNEGAVGVGRSWFTPAESLLAFPKHLVVLH